jgi:ribosomal protein L17
MAKLYGEIAAKALLTLDKSFARANGQPLDASEVYYSLQAAKDYAATAQAYIGQKIVVIENGIVSHYSVEDTAGNLKELGSKPVADGTTVAIGADGKITLANIAEANKTGTYNAVLVNGVLTWVKPSETTVEGLSDLIQALTGRMDTAEADIDALQAAVGVAAKEAVGEEGAEDYEPAVPATGLHKAIADETARAEAAEKALGERIDGIDFVDGDELATALEPYAKSADVVANDTYATDKKAIDDEAAAIREIAEDARDSLNTFLTSEEIDTTVNTLKEIQAEIDKMTDATELATALASKADKSYVDEELAKKATNLETLQTISSAIQSYDESVQTTYETITNSESKIATAK